MSVNTHVEVIKQNSLGIEVWRYTGTVVEKTKNALLLEAFFNRSDLPFHGLVLREGDRFLEVYFTDRWYNVFEIHDRLTDELKCWYCNVTSPTVVNDGIVAYRDLALDVLVYPDGSQQVLDEDEFAELQVSNEEKAQALAALEELRIIFSKPDSFSMCDFLR
ncbi:MAG TPA: DUF402 domain-containing protein [Anaerolineaceae bacterium]|nr:DUF402 domain-containing protein [Anaerolineaceae bacterium]